MIKDSLIQLIPYSVRKPLRSIYESSQKNSLRKLHSQFIRPGMLVFDIGANIGFYTESFLSLGAQVLCVEPQPYCVHHLVKKFNGHPGVRLLELGVAENRGERVLHIDPRNNTTATFSERFVRQGPFQNRRWGDEVTVPVTTLDDLVREYGTPGYCKIDVEGYELNVLRGLSTPIPCISFEYYLGFMDDVTCCLEHLETLGPLSLNYAPNYDFTHLALQHWTNDKHALLDKISRSTLQYAGDIFVRFI